MKVSKASSLVHMSLLLPGDLSNSTHFLQWILVGEWAEKARMLNKQAGKASSRHTSCGWEKRKENPSGRVMEKK